MTADKKYKRLQKTFGLLAGEPLSKHTSFRVGGPADLLALPSNRPTLAALLSTAKKEGIPVTIIGGGSNILVSDKGIRGLVIILRELKSFPWLSDDDHTNVTKQDETTIGADAGERLSTVCRFAMDQGLSGLEFAAGIPGTLGGAIMMNAGTAGWDISSVIASVDVIDTQSLTYHTIKKENLAFSYRNLDVKDKIIVGANLTLAQADPELIKKTFYKSLKLKKATQPVSLASAGCFF